MPANCRHAGDSSRRHSSGLVDRFWDRRRIRKACRSVYRPWHRDKTGSTNTSTVEQWISKTVRPSPFNRTIGHNKSFSGRSKCTRMVDSKCATFEGLIAPCAAWAALGRECPQSESSTIDSSPLRARLVASMHCAGTRHASQDRCQARGGGKESGKAPCFSETPMS